MKSPPSSAIPKATPLCLLPFSSTGGMGAKPGRCAWSAREGHLVASAARPLAESVGSAARMLPALLPQTVLTRFRLATARQPTVRLGFKLDSTHHDR